MYGFVFHLRIVFLFILLCVALPNLTFGQVESRNGWVLPTEGTVRILMVFVEIDHDVDPSVDAFPKGSAAWKVNRLPEYRDDIVNVYEGEDSLMLLTQYYDETSFGELTILGDYFPEIITLKQSEIGRNKTKILRSVVDRINSANRISSQNLSLEDFDFWENESKKGSPKSPSDSFSGVDHLMIFLRNFNLIRKANGQASAAMAGKIGGYGTDSYSVFGAGDGIPFKILKHEFNHLLIGGNNFHSGGGNSAGFRSYTVALQGGWSMMGAANSALLSVSSWDRYWLGWSPKENQFEISARDRNDREVNGDLNPSDGGKRYVLRDFVTTGDALRIKLPFVPEDEFPQWIWLENHTTYKNNGSPTDVFNYEHYECIEPAVPSVFVVRQIDANETSGKALYRSVYADYLKPIPATGAYDYVWDKEKLDLGPCVDNRPHFVYTLKDEFENPLTGHHELEEPFYFTDSTSSITADNMRRLSIRRNRNGSYKRHPHLGDPNYGMSEDGVNKIGLGTNPSTASTITHVNNRRGKSTNRRNSDSVYLNGICIEIIQTRDDLSVEVEVSFNDTLMEESRRWAGSEIVLSNHNSMGSDLYVNSTLTLDRGKTITRFVEPDTVMGEIYFSSPTVLRITSGAKMTVEAEVRLLKDSKIIVEPGGELELLRGSKIFLEDSAEIVFESGSSFSGRGKIKFNDSSNGIVGELSTLKLVKRRTCRKNRFELKP